MSGKYSPPPKCIADIFTGILRDELILPEWQCRSVSFLCKRGGNAGLPKGYRPLTITSVVYCLFTQVVESWMRAWAENKGALTEMQNVFRDDCRLEDNVFVLT